MDFSSVERALQSLRRRNPPLSKEVVDLAQQLSESSTTNNNDNVNVALVLQLLNHPEREQRWESLAVGLYVATDVLSTFCHAHSRVYVEGPRAPCIDTPSSSTVRSETDQEQQQQQKSSTNASANATADAASSADDDNDDASNKIPREDAIRLCATVLPLCRLELEHKEPRVRTLVAKAVGACVRCAKATNDEGLHHERRVLYHSLVTSLKEHLTTGPVQNEEVSKDSTGAVDDTTGWRALETNWQGMASYMEACGDLFLQEQQQQGPNHPENTTEGFDLPRALEQSCIDHVNRHVRAAGIAVLDQWITSCVLGSSSSSSFSQNNKNLLLDENSKWRKTIVNVLKVTLADNWSQVRMAASVLCRSFLVSLLSLDPNSLPPLYPILLPRMCLNRFYLAQGVKLYSLETWRLLFQKGGNGLETIANHAAPVCRYYVKMADADNHAVREAACQAVAELAHKVGQHPVHASKLQPFVSMLLQALLMCFHDESWPVRDEACLACGTFCKAYPEECRPELKTLYERWTEQLTDQIWSVRQDAAVALGDAMEAYGTAFQDEIFGFLKKNLGAARDQPKMSKEEYKERQNDIDVHTDSQLYSCGSLAPKLRKGGAGRIGCSSCGVTRPKAPWEATDGCVYLIRELCVRGCSDDSPVSLTDETFLPLMEELADVCRVKHFPQSDDLRATLWRQLPVMAQALGKQRFKRHYLQLFLELLMNNLDKHAAASALSVHAAGQCVEELATLVGPSIFRGRLEEDWQQEAFDKVMQERQRAGAGGGPMMMMMGANGPPPPMDGFSPFGPPPPTAAAGGMRAPGGGPTDGFSPFGPPGMMMKMGGGGGGSGGANNTQKAPSASGAAAPAFHPPAGGAFVDTL